MDTSSQSNNIIVEVIGDLPYYVPFPENVLITPSLIGVEPFKIEIKQFKPLRHPNDSHGDGVDDRKGTFLRSMVRVIFPVNSIPSDELKDFYERKAIDLTNRVLIAIRYVAFDPTIIHIREFEHCTIRLWSVASDGTLNPASMWSDRTSYGPFGLTLQATLSGDALETVWYVFNGLSPMNNSWLLILDAKYHNALGDISRAILDIATALEINIENLISVYSNSISDLAKIEIDDVGIYQLYDSILSQATDHSLHEKPDLFYKLEYIRELRNSIAHNWRPLFKVSYGLKRRSKFLDRHMEMDGHSVSDKEEVDSLIKDAIDIIDLTISWFKQKQDRMFS
jgi:hypothetical protein